MTEHWDEFSKSLAEETVPRRESLRRLGAVLAGAVLGPLGLATASAGQRQQDPCRDFCRCRGKSDKNQCLAACNACAGETWRMCGSCGTHVCCREPGPWEYGQCIDGECRYACYYGTVYGDAVYCDGVCTFLNVDPDNCGDCGIVCGGSTPYCNQGMCSPCRPGTADCDGDGVCETDTDFDNLNCGACGVWCSITPSETCSLGVCEPTEPCWDCGY